MGKLKILAIADIHYIGVAKHTSRDPERECKIAHQLVERVLEKAKALDIDLLLVLGDIVDNGHAEGVYEDMLTIKNVIDKSGIPTIAIAGNHEHDPELFSQIFNCHEGLHQLKDYQIITFMDSYEYRGFRNFEKMDTYFTQADSTKPIIVLQHPVIYPPIDHSYPYNITDADKIADYYSKKNVLLSISGHYHAGVESLTKDGVTYITCATLCEPPFIFTVITLDGNTIDYKQYGLDQLP